MAKRLFEGLTHTKNYALFRPVPPKSLIEDIVSKLTNKELAVDIGCGSGQSTQALSAHFEKVIGIDVSSAQIEQAQKLGLSNKVQFQVGPAEKLENFKDSSVDLVSCCQAIHWFDFAAFYQEVDRVLRPQGGLLAIYGYHLTEPVGPNTQAAAKIKSLRDKIFKEITGPYWTPERKLVDEAYKGIPPGPYSPVERSDWQHYTEIQASLSDLSGYIQTWSGFQKFQQVKGDKAAHAVIQDFELRCKEALEVPEAAEPSQISLVLRTHYFSLLARKP